MIQKSKFQFYLLAMVCCTGIPNVVFAEQFYYVLQVRKFIPVERTVEGLTPDGPNLTDGGIITKNLYEVLTLKQARIFEILFSEPIAQFAVYRSGDESVFTLVEKAGGKHFQFRNSDYCVSERSSEQPIRYTNNQQDEMRSLMYSDSEFGSYFTSSISVYGNELQTESSFSLELTQTSNTPAMILLELGGRN